MPVLTKPAAPTTGKVTHYSIELVWEDAYQAAEKKFVGDERIRVIVQQQDKSGQWNNTVYQGYAKRHTVEGLECQTQYSFRFRFQSNEGTSDWSPVISVTTAKEPMTGIHLHRSVAMNDVMGVERILETGEVNIEVTDKYGFTPLMQAAQRGYTEIMELLMKNGAEVDAANDAGKTALMLACFSGKLEAAQLLRERGAKYDVRDKGGSTALHWAIDGQNLEIIEWCLEDGWEVDIQDSGSQWTPLLRCAAVNGNKDVARVLIKNGAAVNTTDVDGKTPLMIAVINGHQALVDTLLKSDADLLIKNAYGKNAYEMALSMDKRRITKTLEEHMEKLGIPLNK